MLQYQRVVVKLFYNNAFSEAKVRYYYAKKRSGYVPKRFFVYQFR